MSGRAVRFTLTAVLLAAAAIFALRALLDWKEVAAFPRGAWLHYPSSIFSGADLAGIRESEARQTGEKIEFCAFSQEGRVPVSSRLFSRTLDADLIRFFGDITLVLPGAQLPGQFSVSDDSRGCAVSQDIAYALFGSLSVTGETLDIGGEEYRIRGIAEGIDGAILLPVPGRGSEKQLSVLALNTAQSQNPRNLAEEFRSRHSLPEPQAVTLSGGGQAARLIALLPEILLLLFLLCPLLQELWALRRMPFLFLLWTLGTLAILFCGVYFSGIHLSFPQSLIPTRWSDFEFWGRLLESYQGNFRGWVSAPKWLPERLQLAAVLRLSADSALSCTAILILRKRWKAYGKPGES